MAPACPPAGAGGRHGVAHFPKRDGELAENARAMSYLLLQLRRASSHLVCWAQPKTRPSLLT